MLHCCDTGGSDNIVVIWKSTGQGLLRYNHNTPVQRVKYNPMSLQLVSCSDVRKTYVKYFYHPYNSMLCPQYLI